MVSPETGQDEAIATGLSADTEGQSLKCPDPLALPHLSIFGFNIKKIIIK